MSDYQALLDIVIPEGHNQLLSRKWVDDLRRRLQEGDRAIQQMKTRQSQACGHCASRDREVETLRQQVKDLRAMGTSHQSAPNTSSVTDTDTRGGSGQGGVSGTGLSTEERVKDVREDTARRVGQVNTAMCMTIWDQATQLKKQLDATIQDLSRVSLLKIQQEAELKERIASLQSELGTVNQSAGGGPSDGHAASARSGSRVRGGRAGPSASGVTDHTQSLRAEISTLRSQVHSLTNDKAALQHQVSGYATLHNQAQGLTRRLEDMTREKERLEYKWGGKGQKLREAEASASEAERRVKEWSAYADRLKTQLEQGKRENQEMRDRLQEGAHRELHLEQKVKKTRRGVYAIESANPTSLQSAYSAMLTTTLGSIKAGVKVKRRTPEWEELEGEWLDLVGEWEG
ncbi:hypothetical protein KIPB_012919, partial [Kipferlia bialata]|eukprot:g12919.t1